MIAVAVVSAARMKKAIIARMIAGKKTAMKARVVDISCSSFMARISRARVQNCEKTDDGNPAEEQVRSEGIDEGPYGGGESLPPACDIDEDVEKDARDEESDDAEDDDEQDGRNDHPGHTQCGNPTHAEGPPARLRPRPFPRPCP